MLSLPISALILFHSSSLNSSIRTFTNITFCFIMSPLELFMTSWNFSVVETEDLFVISQVFISFDSGRLTTTSSPKFTAQNSLKLTKWAVSFYLLSIVQVEVSISCQGCSVHVSPTNYSKELNHWSRMVVSSFCSPAISELHLSNLKYLIVAASVVWDLEKSNPMPSKHFLTFSGVTDLILTWYARLLQCTTKGIFSRTGASCLKWFWSLATAVFENNRGWDVNSVFPLHLMLVENWQWSFIFPVLSCKEVSYLALVFQYFKIPDYTQFYYYNYSSQYCYNYK